MSCEVWRRHSCGVAPSKRGPPIDRFSSVAQEPLHVSAYALIIEDGTKLARQIRRGEVPAVDDDLQAEVLTAYELGYRTLLTSRLSLDIALFNNHYSNLSQWTVGSPVLSMTPSPYLTVPFTYTNVTTATKTRGIEVVADWRPFD